MQHGFKRCLKQEMHYSDAWLLQMKRQTERWDCYKQEIASCVAGWLDQHERLGLKDCRESIQVDKVFNSSLR